MNAFLTFKVIRINETELNSNLNRKMMEIDKKTKRLSIMIACFDGIQQM